MRTTLVFLLALLYYGGAVSISMDHKNYHYCFIVDLPEKAVLGGSYLVSGESEDETKTTVKNSLNQQIFDGGKTNTGVITIRTGANSFFPSHPIEGNYTICVDNLSRTTKTFTLHYEITLESSIDITSSQSRKLKSKVDHVYSSLGRISSNIDKLKIRETVQGESNVFLMVSDYSKQSKRYCLEYS
eukprot:TRINITY_DN4711_c0_g1_i1.p1 TRINITY_DN4711_c0_g1~~TRINITY_DN4711_c0_g1_i1.p1  ORF type:complete len:186 (-),score=38.22 TRINITY_DN4711_c0_g1_i1:275-832(-)